MDRLSLFFFLKKNLEYTQTVFGLVKMQKEDMIWFNSTLKGGQEQSKDNQVSQLEFLKEYILKSDAVISTAAIPGRKAPILIDVFNKNLDDPIELGHISIDVHKEGYESTLKYGVTGFTVYNKMYLPTGFSDPSKEYESLINDVTFGDFDFVKIPP